MNIKNLGLFLILGFFFYPIQTTAQRVFAPDESGVLVELKEGKKGKCMLIVDRAEYPRIMHDIVTSPLRIYIYSDFEIEEKELFIQQTAASVEGDIFTRGVFHRQRNEIVKIKGNIKKISPNIYEIASPEEVFASIDLNMIANARTNKHAKVVPGTTFVIGFEPNKTHKKEGLSSKYWYANISQLPYDIDDIKWSTEQAIESINQIMEIGKSTEQLFANIKPQQIMPQIVDGQAVQYVVVQNQPSNIPQEIKQESKSEEKVEIISDVDKNIPFRDINNENTFALVIANEDYKKVAPVKFALRDGQKINEYLKKTLGIEKDHIAYLENATLNDMRYEINKLSKICDAYNGEASFIIYYIGHGIPDERNGNGYLLPIDGYGNDITTGYPLIELYSQLSELDAKKIVLFTDACFSGANKSGDMLVAARGVAIRSNPNEARGHLIAFSACQGDETAYSYDEQGHGLLTYFFLKKLKESGGNTTLGELEEYITDNVSKTAIVINGKPQTPHVSISPEFLETWRDKTFLE